jgi:hypothetical protein
VVYGKPIEKGTIQQACDVMRLVESIYAADHKWPLRERHQLEAGNAQ